LKRDGNVLVLNLRGSVAGQQQTNTQEQSRFTVVVC